MSWARGIDENGRPAGYAIQAICDEPDCGIVIDRGVDYKCKRCGRYFCEHHREFLSDEEYDPADWSHKLGGGFCRTCLVLIAAEHDPSLARSGRNPQEDAEPSPYASMAREDAQEWADRAQDLFAERGIHAARQRMVVSMRVWVQCLRAPRLGYGRYDDDPEHIGCPRAKSDMTPCVARDGALASDMSGNCVGCFEHASNLLRDLVHEVTKPDQILLRSADQPDSIDLVRELREAVGLFSGAMPITPKAAWEEALDKVRSLVPSPGQEAT